MKTMTVHDLSEFLQTAKRTVHYWVEKVSAKNAQIRAKVAQAKGTSKPAEFTLNECLEIVRAGGSPVLADLLSENAGKTKGKFTPVLTLPNGKQMEVMRKIYGNDAMAKRLDFLIGFPGDPAKLTALPAPSDYKPATEFVRELNAIVAGLPIDEKSKRIARFAGMKTQQRFLEKQYQDLINGHLDFGSQP